MSAEILTLAHDELALDLCPGLGGSIANFRWRHPSRGWIDVLRPTPPNEIARGEIEAVACFPLTPFSNRLRKGRFRFQGREIVLPINAGGPHAEHGHGWQRPWQVAMAGKDRAILRLTHGGDAWPFNYTIEQRFQLSGRGLDVEMVAHNDSDRPMPYGFGLHPYFPRTPKCRLTATVGGFWETDGEVMPLRHVVAPPGLDPGRGLPIAERTMDNAFTGWGGRAIIDWPEDATRLTMMASGPLSFLVVYIPPGESYFCAEPVSNCTDAFNLAHERDDTGLLVVEPGASACGRIAFQPAATG